MTVDIIARCVQGKQVSVTDAMVKVNVPPYLLVVDLYGNIRAAETKIYVQHGRLDIHLTKVKKFKAKRATMQC